MRPLVSALRPDREGHGDNLLLVEPGTLVAKATERLGVETRLDGGECIFVAELWYRGQACVVRQ